MERRKSELMDFLLTVQIAAQSGLEDPEEAEDIAWRVVSLSDEFRDARTQRDLEKLIDEEFVL